MKLHFNQQDLDFIRDCENLDELKEMLEEKLEDYHDLKLAKDYERRLKKGKIKFIDYEEYKRSLNYDL